MGFSEPSDPDFFAIKEHVGALCIIAANEYLPNFSTAMGMGPAVRAEIVVIDGPGSGKRYPDGMFFGKKIVPQLKGSIGAVVLGRIVQGTAKAGQSAPYQLAKATTDDVTKANSWVKVHGDVEPSTDTHSASGQPYAPDLAPQGHTAAPPQQSYPQWNGGNGTTTTTTPAATYAPVPAHGEEPPF